MRHSNRNAGYLLRANLKQNLKFFTHLACHFDHDDCQWCWQIGSRLCQAGGLGLSKEIVKMLQAPGMAAMVWRDAKGGHV